MSMSITSSNDMEKENLGNSESRKDESDFYDGYNKVFNNNNPANTNDDSDDTCNGSSNTYFNTNNVTGNLKQDSIMINLSYDKKIDNATNKKKIKRKPHTKYHKDNLTRKVKSILCKELRDYINQQILTKVSKRIMKEIKIKKILVNKRDQNYNATIKYNRALLKKTLGEILSYDVTRRNKVSPDHNKKLINILLNIEDTKIKEFSYNLFNLTYKDCLEHFRGTKNNEYLKGMKKFDEIKNKFEQDEEYLKRITNLLMNFDKI